MPQYAILRFAKHKGAPSGALEAHHERKKNGMPVIPTLIRNAVNTTSTPSNRRSGIHDLSSTESRNPAVVQERTAQGLWIR